MNDKNWLIAGGLIILVLLLAIATIFFVPLKQIKNLTGIKSKPTGSTSPSIRLNEDYANTDNYTLITINDIIDGTVLKSEKAKAIPFSSDVIPMKYVRKDEGYNNAYLTIDSATFKQMKENPDRLPFRNSYFYKIKNGDIWYTILGQQIQNSDGTTSFLHFLIHKGTEIYSWGGNGFFVEPKIIAPDQIFVDFGPRDFFSADKDYYMKGGKVEMLINSWLKTGIVPDDLQREVLLMSTKL
ncbi:MAG: hypothetical protein WC851_05290 [Candidatus Shapirobacteria bacterium]|jgi:hypothetical protein